MKKNLLTAIFAVFCLTSTFAQDQGDIELGGGLGVNFSAASVGGESTDSKTSFNVNFSGEYYFSDRWGIKGRLIYDKKGWANGFINDENTNQTVTTDFNLDYITIPVMANWHFGRNRNWYLNFGAYAGFLINAKDSKLEMDLKESFNTLDFGFAYGIGYKLEISDYSRLFLEFDNQSGLTGIFKEGDSIQIARSSFNIGVQFNL